MKKIIILTLFAVLSLGVYAQTHWAESFESAKAKASKTDTPIMIVFSGSDWCKPCIKLKKNILDTPEFVQKMEGSWVLYNADFPYKKKLNKKLVKLNEELAEKYNPKGLFPWVVVINKEGKVIAETGYKNDNVDSFIQKLKSQYN